jgi:hypothetical protein
MGAPPSDINWTDYQTEDSESEVITTNDPTNQEAGMTGPKGS